GERRMVAADLRVRRAVVAQLGRVLVVEPARRLVAELDRARARRHASREDLEQRRLARAVLAEDADAIAARDAQVDPLEQRRRVAVSGRELARLEHELAAALG